ncbi:hypothetical protein EDC04DRAFT_2768176 [Pisolithus marmoratus]|nr:hypothetical protein EDC04DRAFT_2768176 [Pisolithus marmoratus]
MHHPLTSNGSSEYYITSVAHQQYLGAAEGVLPPHAIIILPPNVQAPKFTVTAASGDNTYTIKISENFVRGLDERVYSFEDGVAEDWIITFREADSAYTVERKADSPMRAWTTPENKPSPRDEHNPLQIFLETLIIPTFPPHLLPIQLFKFELAHE